MPTGGSPFPYLSNYEIARKTAAKSRSDDGNAAVRQSASAKRQCAKRFEFFRRQCALQTFYGLPICYVLYFRHPCIRATCRT